MFGSSREYSGTDSYKYVEKLIKQGKQVFIVSPYIDLYYAKFLLRHSAGKHISIISSSIDSKAERLLSRGSFPGKTLAMLIILAGLDYLTYEIGIGISALLGLLPVLIFITILLAVVFAYKLRHSKPEGIKLKIPKEFVHAKFYVNEKTAISGSANLTYRGMHKNVEHLQINYGKREIDSLLDDFRSLWRRA